MTSIVEHTDRTLPRAVIFVASEEVTLKNRRRAQGIVIALLASGAIWAGLITGTIALVNVLN
jgi:hypothetical protein